MTRMSDDKTNYRELLQESLIKLTDARKKIQAYEKKALEPIAIIGLAGRFPGAKNVDQFFENILNGLESITQFNDEELMASGVPQEEYTLPNYVKSKGVLEGYDLFDAQFFNLTPKQAELMDPQIRLFLETAWEAMEDAGYFSEEQAGRTGVFAGMGSFNNHLAYMQSILGPSKNFSDLFQRVTNNAHDYLSTRISYQLNLTGPSFTLETACSTSLLTVIEACTHLLNRECDMALAGGVCVTLPMKIGYAFETGLILSPDGHCRPLDAHGNGIVPGNGVGIVVLKRYDDALRDGDHIYALIKGFATNNDGSSKVGYTAPSIEGQAKVIESALVRAGVNPEQISLYEAHATATSLGDPIEIAAATRAYRKYTTEKNYCPVGSVKGNIGHLDTAAGIAGLIKTVLAIKNKKLPPSINFKAPNPKIQIENSPFYVLTEAREWELKEGPRMAAVSSFGIGGSNAHVILSEAPAETAPSLPKLEGLTLRISAKTEKALNDCIQKYISYLSETKEVWEDIAYTANMRRANFDYEINLLANNAKEAAEKLIKGDFTRGKSHKIDSSVDPKSPRCHVVPLPSYPFQREHFGISPLEYKKRESGVSSSMQTSLASIIRQASEAERKAFILNYLSLMLNQIAGISLESFKPSAKLQDYALDSLMIAALRNAIEADLDVAINIPDIPLDMDFDSLCDLVISYFSRGEVKMKSETFDSRVTKILRSSSDIKYQLFLIAPFGFGESAYKNWSSKLMEGIELIYLAHQFKGNWAEMTAELAQEVKMRATHPFIIYGHSMGGILAYELVVHLENQMDLHPEALMVSSVAPPTQFARAKSLFPFNEILQDDVDINSELLIKAHYLPPKNMAMKLISSEEMSSDIHAIKNYQNEALKKIDAPIVAIQTNNDVLIRDGNLISEWAEYTKSNFSYFEIEGTHLFFINPPKSVFDEIEKIFQNIDSSKIFKPGVYRLTKYTLGSDNNVTFPFGLEPEGFLLYDESTHAMAAYVWHKRAREPINPLELMMSYFDYCGFFSLSVGVVSHHVTLSSFPNYSGDIVARDYRYENGNLILTALPKTKKKQISEAYFQLQWELLPNNPQSSRFMGCWEILDYTENNIAVLGENVVGQMIVAECGYFSWQISSAERKDFKDNNPFLATDVELLSAYDSYRSLFGKYECGVDKSVFLCQTFSPAPFNPNFSISYSLVNDELQLSYRLEQNNGIREVKSRWKRLSSH
jgi:3-oxoacyl-(acyl-carrier-protein) synthase/surfactin synthase thioesterase subunit